MFDESRAEDQEHAEVETERFKEQFGPLVDTADEQDIHQRQRA